MSSSTGLQSVYIERDCHGVQDFVMLDDFRSEEAFVNNLEVRFRNNLIYTYIGNVCVSVNPYKDLNIYSTDHIRWYYNVNLYELPPHIFAITDQAYRGMRDELLDQCILISGESGAGKTEASKKILQFLALNSTNTGKAGNIRDRLLQSNPILEAFGNAKTIRNDNSSRFGKYMEVQFDFRGEPLGGKISNYLLEKCRVVSQMPGERNFHIFYHLLLSGDTSMLSQLKLEADPDKYLYTRQGSASYVATVDDKKDYKAVLQAFKDMAFSQQEINELMRVVAAVLKFGEVDFQEINRDQCSLVDTAPVEDIAELLGIPLQMMESSLVHKSVVARGQEIKGDLSRENALYGRDAIAKAIYQRMFTWLVQRVNKSLAGQKAERETVMGLLDIYGFEIMQTNSFEQFCINYCNEKLQQLFIELTLKSEQEEYRNEGIKWEEIEFFNNKIICDMVEEKHKGIVAILDEECLRPGNKSDATFLERLNQQMKDHKHYLSHATAGYQERKTLNMGRLDFQIRHYAGDVVYFVEGFMDKNNDLLFRDYKVAMNASSNTIIAECFPQSELESQKRPVTAGTQFKNSLNELINTLMAKQPSYVRCIKPNHEKKAGVFDPQLVRHQVKYLGLMENLRVRRAGFAYRRKYELFLERYKSLCPKTWPHYNGEAKEGVRTLMQHLSATVLPMGPDAYKMGKTKLFIREPRTLFAIEGLFLKERHVLATKIQAKVKGYLGRKKFKEMKVAAIILAKHWRRALAKKTLQKLREAYVAIRLGCIQWMRRRQRAKAVIKKFIRGYLTRNEPRSEDNAIFLDFARHRWLLELRNCLPKTVLDRSWIQRTPPYLEQTSKLLRRMHKLYQCKQYRDNLTKNPKLKTQLAQKLAASELFSGRKANYPNSVAKWFSEDRLEPVLFAGHPLRVGVEKMMKKSEPEFRLKYVINVTKFDKTSYKTRQYVLIVTAQAIFIVYPENFKLNYRLDFSQLTGISVSKQYDGIFVLHTSGEVARKQKDKGDWIFHTPYVIEAVMQIALASRKIQNVKIEDQITHRRPKGQPGTIVFAVGPEPLFVKNKAKQLEVTSVALPVPEHYQRFKSGQKSKANLGSTFSSPSGNSSSSNLLQQARSNASSNATSPSSATSPQRGALDPQSDKVNQRLTSLRQQQVAEQAQVHKRMAAQQHALAKQEQGAPRRAAGHPK